MFKFYLLIIFLSILCIILLIKNIMMKNLFKNIIKETNKIINTDTNSVIRTNYSLKEFDEFIKLLNKTLKKLRKKQIEYESGISTLKKSVTNITHDIRTPLSAIIGYLELIDKKKLTKKQIEYLEISLKKSKEISTLTENLLDYAKCLDKDVKKEEVCLNNILESVICDYYELFKIQSIEPVIKITNHKIVRKLDVNMLRRIFENIINNGIKYSEGEFIVELHDDGTLLFINKTSLLDKTTVGKIFDRYYTVENAKKSNGIGLSIAKDLININGGNINATYKNGKLYIKIKFESNSI